MKSDKKERENDNYFVSPREPSLNVTRFKRAILAALRNDSRDCRGHSPAINRRLASKLAPERGAPDRANANLREYNVPETGVT